MVCVDTITLDEEKAAEKHFAHSGELKSIAHQSLPPNALQPLQLDQPIFFDEKGLQDLRGLTGV